MEAARELLAENRLLLPAAVFIMVSLPLAGFWIGSLLDWLAGRWVGVGYVAEYVPPKNTALAAAGPPQLVIFFHLAKCAGTAVRELFQSSGRWGILPYCQPAQFVLEMLAKMSAPPPYLFWEQHCNPELPALHATLNASAQLHFAPHVTSFIVLRDPIDLALSDYTYFHSREAELHTWARENAEQLLFDPYLLGFQRPRRTLPTRALHEAGNRSLLSRAECTVYVGATMRLLSRLDHIAFVEDAPSFEPIRTIAAAQLAEPAQLGARATTPPARPRMHRINTYCPHCHGAHRHPEVKGMPRHGRELSNRRLRKPPSRAPSAEELRLITRANRCSSRVYAALRRACAKQMANSGSDRCKLSAPHLFRSVN